MLFKHMYSTILAVLYVLLLLPACEGYDEHGPRSEKADGSTVSDAYCPVGTLYDALDDVCYIDCEDLDDDECDLLEDEILQLLEDYIDEDFQRADDAAGTEGSEEGQTLAEYAVEDDLSLTMISQQLPDQDAAFRRIWQDAITLLPKNILSENVVEFQLNTDGGDGSLAFVELIDPESGKWLFAVDPVDYTGKRDQEVVHTLIHEFAHIYFLRAEEIDMSTEAIDGCSRLAVDEGCVNSGSVINSYHLRFWSALDKEHAALVEAGTEGESTQAEALEDAVAEFYSRYSDQFVSEYAATNIVEDMAETFAHFVLSKRPANSETIETYETVAEEKLLFFHGNRDLLRLRTLIRGRLLLNRSEN